jgi:6-pyruvoyltetrahydropterin/6-carboxytetrahydropterin synthase
MMRNAIKTNLNNEIEILATVLDIGNKIVYNGCVFEIEKTYRFEAGHSLIYHDGKCREPHGHSYILTIKLRGDALVQTGPKKNMLLDFQDISAQVKPMIENFLDHKWLNDTLKTDSPTAEVIAKWIFDYLKPKLSSLFSVSVNETATSKATYFL